MPRIDVSRCGLIVCIERKALFVTKFPIHQVMFILHAEHEMNCSTAAARHLASSGVDVYTAVGGAVGALYGPLHGGANEAVLRMLQVGLLEKVERFAACLNSCCDACLRASPQRVEVLVVLPHLMAII